MPCHACCWLLCAQFYTVKDHLDRPYKVLRHNINAAAGSTDEVVYEETDEVSTLGDGDALWARAGSGPCVKARGTD
jgi:protease II